MILATLLVVVMPSVHQTTARASENQDPHQLSTDGPGIYLGLWQPGFPDLSDIAAYERSVRKQAAIVHWYQGWGAANAPLDLDAITRVSDRGSVAMITWEPWDYTKGIEQPEYRPANIAAGHFDDYVRSWARGLASYDGTVLLRFAHEMNHPYYPWSVGVNGNTESDYVAAWRHVHDIFTQEGATNVQWVWSPLIWWEGAPLIEPMYPGDEYVDWVAVDGYNNVDWGGWQSFSQIFGASYERLTALTDKPIMIAEVASAEAGGSKAAWITDMFARLPVEYPEIRAVVWFNESKEADWRVNSSNASLRAFRDAIAPATFLGTVR